MLGFYMVIQDSGAGAVAIRTAPLSEMRDLPRDGSNVLYLSERAEAEAVRRGGTTLFCMGTLVYGKQWRKPALEAIAAELERGRTLREILGEARGQFCLVVHTEDGVSVATDPCGFLPVYRLHDGNAVHVSSMLLPVATNNRVTLRPQAVAEYLSAGYPFGGTLFREIERIDEATLCEFGRTTSEQRYLPDIMAGISFRKHKDLSEAAGLLKDTLIEDFAFLGPDDRVFADITGGFDTRTLSVLLHAAVVRFESGICGEQVQDESNPARRVADVLGVPFHDSYRADDLATFKEVADLSFAVGVGIPVPFKGVNLLEYYRKIDRQFDVHVAGYAGTQLAGVFLEPLGLTSRVTASAAARKLMFFDDVIKPSILTKGQYYEEAERKIDDVLDMVGSRAHQDAATALGFFIFNRYYHGALMGTHNAFMPVYAPFVEVNVLRLTLETSAALKHERLLQRALLSAVNPEVSRIQTSHGFTAEVAPAQRPALPKRLKKLARVWGRRALYQWGGLSERFGVMGDVQRTATAIAVSQAEPPMWLREADSAWSPDLAVLELLDRDKVKARTEDPRIPLFRRGRTKTRILYINHLIEASGAKW